MVIRNKHITN